MVGKMVEDSRVPCSDNEPDRISCSLCPALLEDDKALKEHFRIHDVCRRSDRTHRKDCLHCEKIPEKDRLELPLEKNLSHGSIPHPIHRKKIKFKCQYCPREFIKEDYLRQHELLHLDPGEVEEAVEAPIDDGDELIDGYPKRLWDLVSRNKGVAKKKPKVRKKLIFCEVCGKGYDDRSDLNKHVRETHSAIKKWSCDECAYSCTKPNVLIAHKRLHNGERPFKCNICDSRHREKSHLLSHMVTHTQERPFKCEYCVKAFKSKRNLVSHVKNIHKIGKGKQLKRNESDDTDSDSDTNMTQ